MRTKVGRVSGRAAQWGLLFALPATLAFARSRPFGQAGQEIIAIAKWVGIILRIICGIGLVADLLGTKLLERDLRRIRLSGCW